MQIFPETKNYFDDSFIKPTLFNVLFTFDMLAYLVKMYLFNTLYVRIYRDLRKKI